MMEYNAGAVIKVIYQDPQASLISNGDLQAFTNNRRYQQQSYFSILLSFHSKSALKKNY
jgi:hypothetical protein